mmetsp:Transcript_30309/g.86514  ORF Transcript_30309/g.86514 Transcript_30309/m.86514 type:complete len:254 (+) Transcript_30309:762-1523(+)
MEVRHLNRALGMQRAESAESPAVRTGQVQDQGSVCPRAGEGIRHRRLRPARALRVGARGEVPPDDPGVGARRGLPLGGRGGDVPPRPRGGEGGPGGAQRQGPGAHQARRKQVADGQGHVPDGEDAGEGDQLRDHLREDAGVLGRGLEHLQGRGRRVGPRLVQEQARRRAVDREVQAGGLRAPARDIVAGTLEDHATALAEQRHRAEVALQVRARGGQLLHPGFGRRRGHGVHAAALARRGVEEPRLPARHAGP